MNTILKKLAITPEQYQEIIWRVYNKWCQDVTTNNLEYQQVLANSAINAWFRVEFSKCEVEFLEKTRFYTSSNVTAKDFHRCHADCLYKLFSIRPMPLLNQIVKPKVKGISIFNAIYIN